MPTPVFGGALRDETLPPRHEEVRDRHAPEGDRADERPLHPIESASGQSRAQRGVLVGEAFRPFDSRSEIVAEGRRHGPLGWYPRADSRARRAGRWRSRPRAISIEPIA